MTLGYTRDANKHLRTCVNHRFCIDFDRQLVFNTDDYNWFYEAHTEKLTIISHFTLSVDLIESGSIDNHPPDHRLYSHQNVAQITRFSPHRIEKSLGDTIHSLSFSSPITITKTSLCKIGPGARKV